MRLLRGEGDFHFFSALPSFGPETIIGHCLSLLLLSIGAEHASAACTNSNTVLTLPGDIDSDGVDFLAWQQQFTGPGPLAAATAVPEPTGATLLLAAFVYFSMLHSKR